MGKKRKGSKMSRSVPVYDSDDERAYASEKTPDPKNDDYFDDEIEQFNKQRDKLLLDKGVKYKDDAPTSKRQEVFALDNTDSDEEDAHIAEMEAQLKKYEALSMKQSMASDLEDESDDDEEEEEKGWGGKRNKFYGDDLDDYDDVDSGASDTERAVEREKEAMEMQKRQLAQYSEEDFGYLELMAPKKDETTSAATSTTTSAAATTSSVGISSGSEKVERDLSKLSTREKMVLLENESPELPEMVADYKKTMGEAIEKWIPLFELIENGTMPDCSGATYIRAKFKLSLNYCINLHMYLVLKARRTFTPRHPIVGRINQYREKLRELATRDAEIADEINLILHKLKNGEPLVFKKPAPDKPTSSKSILKKRKRIQEKTTANKKAKKLSELGQDSDDEEEEEEKAQEEVNDFEKEYLVNGGDEEAMEGEEELGFEEEEEDEEGGRRAITYQMEKNKGLTPKRKKEQRNPRVKYRNKYRSANIRRKGQVREVRRELKPYGGELSGIRCSIKRSVRLK